MLRGKSGAAKWALVLGAYKIEPCRMRRRNRDIAFTLKRRVLLRGDLHMHSLNSDGRYSVDEIIGIAKRRGLDFIFLTDHNNIVQNDEIRSSDALVVMPGMEWTHYDGHANLPWGAQADLSLHVQRQAYDRRDTEERAQITAPWCSSTIRCVVTAPGSGASTCRSTV
jgi:hypothetical protein